MASGADPTGRQRPGTDFVTTTDGLPAGADLPQEPAAPAAAPMTDAAPKKTDMFSSLRVRNYRLFFTGQVVSNTGTWMQRVTQDWLVLSITGSSTAVGITTALQFLPVLLFGLYGGVISDRYAKRKILLISQSVMGLLGLILAALTLSGQVQVWHVYLIAFCLGLVTVVDNPSRQAFVVEMVGPHEVRNAVSLNSANFQSARIIGPAVAGVLIAAVGSGWSFMLNGLSFIAPISSLLIMNASELHKVPVVSREKGQLRQGLHYVAERPELLWPIVLIGFIGTFGYNFPVWLSAFANDVFHAGSGAYGMMNTVMAIGSLIGALLAARRPTTRMRLLVGAALGFSLLEMAAAAAPTFWLFMPLLVLIGVFALTFNTTANATVQLATEPAMRGRVMALYMMVFMGGTPVGGPLVGWVTDTYGARLGFLAGAAVSALGAIVVGAILARIGNLRIQVNLHRGNGGRVVAFVPRTEPTLAERPVDDEPARVPVTV